MEKFKLLIAEVNEALKPFGYRKSGNTFFLSKDNNIGIIDFQKSRNNHSDLTSFTINLGVYSTALKAFDSMIIKLKPAISDCHWRQRIGFLLTQKQDHWWNISNDTSITALIIEITNVINSIAVVKIDQNISDESLKKSWMEGRSKGISEQQMYLYLICLLKTQNDINLQSKISELLSFSKGKPFETNIKENLSKIGIEL